LTPIIPSAHLDDVRHEIRGALGRRARERVLAGMAHEQSDHAMATA
jgi:hypothetical protein